MKRLGIVLFLLFASGLVYAQSAIGVETHKVVTVDEQFNVTFIIEGENNPTDFTWNPGSDFQLLWGPQSGKSTSIRIVNGKRTKSSQTTYTYVLRPVKAGHFSLPKATAKVKGKEILSSDVVIEVIASADASQNPPVSSRPQADPSAVSVDSDVFMDVSLNRTDVVVGEPVIATVKLYQRVNIAGFESASFPAFDGFWSQELEAPSNIEFVRETYDGRIWNAALLRKYVLIPQQEGKLVISPAELVCLVNVRVNSPGASIFDGFFDDYRTIRKKVTSKPVAVNVSPLPSGAPASFAGGVGTFSISAKVSKDSLKTHEAASLLVTVTGRGNVSLLQSPLVVFPPDMEVYDTKVSEKIDKSGLAGSKYYEFPFIPRSHGDFVIEPVQYAYYDVNARKYVTLKTEPLTIHVARGNETESAGVVVPGVSRKDVKTLNSDIRFIYIKNPQLEEQGSFFVGTGVFWCILAGLFVAAALLWATFRRLAARKADVAGTRNRKATRLALKKLSLASSFLKQNLHAAFYEELHKALLGFVADKLDIPVAGLSRDGIASALEESGVYGAHIAAYLGILDACEYARYAPDSGNEAMKKHYDAAVEVISSIDSNMKTKRKSSPKHLALLLALMFPLGAHAQDAYVDSLWNVANAAYSEGRTAEAESDYVRIYQLGLESAPLYCNIGNACYKEGKVAEAILWYERAMKIDPSYEDARYNLELLNSMIQDRIDPVPEFILKVWARNVCYLMDSDSWAVAFIVLTALTLAMVLLFFLSRTVALKRTGFFTGIMLLMLSAAALAFSLWQKNDYMRADEAIVMRPVTSVKSAPSASAAKDLFILHEGTKVKVMDTVGGWKNVELADGRQGWLSDDDIEMI